MLVFSAEVPVEPEVQQGVYLMGCNNKASNSQININDQYYAFHDPILLVW